MATATPITKPGKVSRCHAISIDLVINRDDFDPGALALVIPKQEGTWDLTRDTISGPLRLGGRGNDEYRLTGRSALHETRGSPPHYHISVQAGLVAKPFAAPRALPTVKDFFTAVSKGIKSKDSLAITVFGEHTYPREWWIGQTLPVPLPPTGEHDHNAQLTGIEVTYATDSGNDRIMVTSQTERFVVVTVFEYNEAFSDLFHSAVQRSSELGARWFEDPSSNE